jgi:hypothetical protein
MGVPNVFGSATTSIPLSQLDQNFNTTATLGNAAIGLGNVTTTVGNLTLTNVNITSGTINAAVTQSGFAANAVIYSTSTGNLTGNATIFSVNSTSVGIGTSSPTDDQGYTRLLDISSNTGGATYYHATGTSTYGWLGQYNNNITLGTNGASGIIFSNGATPGEKMRLNTNGNLSLYGGTTTATGVGITFPASQSASSDANCLDDYEEGTWTPSVGGTATYQAGNGGRYVKVGNAVAITFQIAINVIGTGSGATISGLPFATGNYGFVQSVSISYFASLTGNCYSLGMYMNNNASTMNFVSTSSLTNTVNNGPALLGNNSVVYGSITYLTA